MGDGRKDYPPQRWGIARPVEQSTRLINVHGHSGGQPSHRRVQVFACQRVDPVLPHGAHGFLAVKLGKRRISHVKPSLLQQLQCDFPAAACWRSHCNPQILQLGEGIAVAVAYRNPDHFDVYIVECLNTAAALAGAAEGRGEVAETTLREGQIGGRTALRSRSWFCCRPADGWTVSPDAVRCKTFSVSLCVREINAVGSCVRDAQLRGRYWVNQQPGATGREHRKHQYRQPDQQPSAVLPGSQREHVNTR